MRTITALALAACLLTSCRSDVGPVPLATPTPFSLQPPAACERCAPTPAGSWLIRHKILQSASLTLTVGDPIQALSQIESAVEELGGVVLSSSSWSSPGSSASANLSARLPLGTLLDMRRVAMGLASQVQNDSVYGQDITVEYARLEARRADLLQAEKHLARLMTQTADLQAADALVLARQMVTQERVNIESQLADYDSRADWASFDVSLNGMAQVLFID
jgi:Domain of unknown function (DUF4349)